MSLLITDHFATAIQVIRTNRMRSFLTTLGMAIGIASITTILSLTSGAKLSIDQQIADLHDNIAIVQPNTQSAHSSILPSLGQQLTSVGSFSESDFRAAQAVDPNLQVAPIMLLNGTANARGTSIQSQTIIATTPSLLQTINLPLEDGQFIEEDNARHMAVLGQQLAIDLFGTDDPIGQLFTIRKQSFTVVGVLKKQDTSINYLSLNFDKAIIISLDGGKQLNQDIVAIQQMNISAPSKHDLQSHLKPLETAIQTSRGGEADFTIIHGDLVSSPVTEVFGIIEKSLTVIAAISLIVGGIGIMNIMLVSVSERTREIGIRKSVGASNSNILSQFVVESLLISLTGGIIGTLLGLVVAFAIGAALWLTPVFTWQIGSIAILTSLAVGVIFGLYPALRASRKDPIESLRQLR